MNLFSFAVGGVPMCHGAGGTGHVAFGARTGGAVVIFGARLLGLAFFFSDSVQAPFKLFPPAVLGVILFEIDALLQDRLAAGQQCAHLVARAAA